MSGMITRRLAGCLAAALLAGTVLAPCAMAEPAATLPSSVAGLPTTSPEAVGMSSERLKRLDAAFKELVDPGEFAGLGVIVARHGKVVFSDFTGYADKEAKVAMSENAIANLFSMSKAVTAAAMMILYEEGKWSPEDPIARHVPEFKDLKVIESVDDEGNLKLVAPDHAPTMAELMSYTAGFGYGFAQATPRDMVYVGKDGQNILFTAPSMQDFIDQLATRPLQFQPGTQWIYGMGSDVQGYIIQKLTGMPFDKFLEKRLFAPLGMKDTFFAPAGRKSSRLARIYERTAPGAPLTPIANQAMFDSHFPAGGGALKASPHDYMRFVQMLANGGELDGVRILAPATVALMTAPHFDETVRAASVQGAEMVKGMKWGYGVAVYDDPALADCPCGKGTFWWGGGGFWWADPESDITVVGMVQRTDFYDKPDPDHLARQFVYQALLDPAK